MRPAVDWYIIRVMPSREAIASNFIESNVAGSETYYPVATSERIVRGVVMHVDKAAFQGYLYARFAGTPDWGYMENCRIAGPRPMRCLDSKGEDYVPMWERSAVVQALQTRMLAGEFNQAKIENPFEQKAIGMLVKIPHGAFIGQKGKVQAIHPKTGQVTVMVKVLGRQTPLFFKHLEIFG